MVGDDLAYDVVRVARQIVLRPYSQHHVIINKTSNRLLKISPRVLPIRSHSTIALRGVLKVSPKQPSYIIVRNFSDRQVCFPKRMIIAQTAKPPNVIHATDQKAFSLKTPDIDVNPSFELPSSNSKHVAAVHYNTSNDRDSQISGQAVVQDDDIKRLAQD